MYKRQLSTIIDDNQNETNKRYLQIAQLKDGLVEHQRRIAEEEAEKARLQAELAKHGEEIGRAQETLEDRNIRLMKAEAAHRAVLADLERAKEEAGRQKEMLRATMLAKQAEVSERDRKVEGACAASLLVYQQMSKTLQTMLAQAVLPFPALTAKMTEQRQRRIVKDHAEFDADWYLANYSDVADSGMDPVLHFINYGLGEGRSPNAATEALRRASF